MLRIRTLGLALVAVLALSAVAASVASAAGPEFKGPFPKPFTATSVNTYLNQASGLYKCGSSISEGTITGAKAGLVTIRFQECHIHGYVPCQSAGAKQEEEVTSTLHMELGYIKKPAPTEVGVALESTSGPTGVVLAMECRTPEEKTLEPMVYKGAVMGLLRPINTATDKFTLKFAEGAEGLEQQVHKFEGEPKKIDRQLEVFIGEATKSGRAVLSAEENILTEAVTEILA